MQYYSKFLLDRLLNEYIFLKKKQGFFLDIGARDGIANNSTYFFEKNLDWTGICVEPNSDAFQKLKKNRQCLCVNCYISNRNEQDRLKVEGMKKVDGNEEIIPLERVTVNHLLNSGSIGKIDFCSINAEGHELEILQSIDQKLVEIDLFLMETASNWRKIKRFMASAGYKHVLTIRPGNLIFVRKAGALKFRLSARLKWNMVK